ncbi:MAG: ribonucleoside-diphosphate reductase subunit alpha [Candidatus Dependentiae bacterium]|jgi:ribonucleoside-diphosphate reductase alpha chain
MHTQTNQQQQGLLSTFTVVKRDSKNQDFSVSKIESLLSHACVGVEKLVDTSRILHELEKNIYSGITTQELERALVLSALPFIQEEPAYSKVAMRLLLASLYKEVFGSSSNEETRELHYKQGFNDYLQKGFDGGQLDQRLLREFDIQRLAQHIKPERDQDFTYMGLQTIHEKYLLKVKEQRIELPQYFWMRVAMGVALGEPEHKTEKACQFYDLVSQFRFVPGTPTLLHAGTTRPQLSSCYLTTIDDDLSHIFKCLADNAQLSKFSGGVANDWTPLRATGALIKSIDVPSQGVIPFLKLVNDVTTVINRSGKRRGATCVYMETWHYDIEDFLDLRRNTGDERRRTHDINTANWIPDLFMQRVAEDGGWTLFTPNDTPDLHDLYGAKFAERYKYYEELARDGVIVQHKVVKAKQLWKKMLTRLFETGHAWVTFKDAFNVRSPQDHDGVIHSTNLCTEIGLNTSKEETAVCNLGSVNMARHITDGKVDEEKLAETIEIAMNMLDNVIDINFYPTKEARTANLRHRPVGLGMMGLQDAMYQADIAFDDPRALDFCDEMMETVSYYAILNSSKLAKERGAYSSFKGSKWDRNIFPIDTLDMLEKERGEKVEVNRTVRKDWSMVREHVQKYGMRNSNTMAIAPTATIANISGCMPCIEPTYKNLYVKANQQGEFTIINRYLVKELDKRGLWTDIVQQKLRYYDGSIQMIEEIPEDLKHKFKTAFELDPEWLVDLTAVRSKWIDQSQSHNIFMQGVSGKKLHEVYFRAWRMGMKGTYYVRSMGATQIEKATLDAKQFGFTQKREYSPQPAGGDVAEAKVPVASAPVTQAITPGAEKTQDQMLGEVKACSIENPECESCQ